MDLTPDISQSRLDTDDERDRSLMGNNAAQHQRGRRRSRVANRGFMAVVRNAFYGDEPDNFLLENDSLYTDPDISYSGEFHLSGEKIASGSSGYSRSQATPLSQLRSDSAESAVSAKLNVFTALRFRPDDDLEDSNDDKRSYGASLNTYHSVMPARSTYSLQVCARSVWPNDEVNDLAEDLSVRVRQISKRSCAYVHEVPPPAERHGDYGAPIECVPKKLRISLKRESLLGKCVPRNPKLSWAWILMAFIAATIALLLLHSRDLAATPTWAITLSGVLAGLFMVSMLVNYSLTILRRLLLSFDVWLLILWSIFLTWCDASANHNTHVTDFISRTVGALLAVCAFLLTDAVDVSHKRWLGLLKLGLGLAYLLDFALWRFSYEYPEHFPNTDPRRTVFIGNNSFFRVHLATIAQCGAATLSAFAFRFAYRKLANRSDTAILQFGATTAPHHTENPARDREVWLKQLTKVGQKSFVTRSSAHLTSRTNLGATDSDQPATYGSTVSFHNQSSVSFTGPEKKASFQHHASFRGADAADEGTPIYSQSSNEQESDTDVDARLEELSRRTTLVRIYVTVTCSSLDKGVVRTSLEELMQPFDAEEIVETRYSASQYQELSSYRHFVPRRILKHFQPDPIVSWPAAARIIRHPWWYVFLLTTAIGLLALISALDGLDIRNQAINVAARCAVILLVSFQILFGISKSIVWYEMSTLEFWYLAVQLPLAIPSSYIYYTDVDAGMATTITHCLMLLANAILMCCVDGCILPRQWSPTSDPRHFINKVKGITFIFFALYGAAQIYLTQRLINDNADFRTTRNFYFTEVSMGSMSEATSFNLLVMELRIIFQILVLKQDMVLMTFATHEETT